MHTAQLAGNTKRIPEYKRFRIWANLEKAADLRLALRINQWDETGRGIIPIELIGTNDFYKI